MEQIVLKIENISQIENVQPLFYTEAGSRLLGIDNLQSDYDVRGVHLLSKDNYFSFLAQKEQIELMESDFLVLDKSTKDEKQGETSAKISNGLDFVSYEWDKFMQMLAKSNPNAWEFWRSEKFYFNKLDNFTFWQQETARWIDFNNLFFHYLSIARTHGKLLAKKPSPKVLFYGLRGLLCACLSAQKVIPPLKASELLACFNEKETLIAHSRLALEKRQNEPNFLFEEKMQTFFTEFIHKEAEKLLSLRPEWESKAKELKICLLGLNAEVKNRYY